MKQRKNSRKSGPHLRSKNHPIRLLQEVGFVDVDYLSHLFPDLVASGAVERKGSINGTIKPEPFDTGRDHFRPKFRHVHVSDRYKVPSMERPCYMVSSDIYGEMRGYRCRRWDKDAQVGNIYAAADTKEAAVRLFIEKFKRLEYNRGQDCRQLKSP